MHKLVLRAVKWLQFLGIMSGSSWMGLLKFYGFCYLNSVGQNANVFGWSVVSDMSILVYCADITSLYSASGASADSRPSERGKHPDN